MDVQKTAVQYLNKAYWVFTQVYSGQILFFLLLFRLDHFGQETLPVTIKHGLVLVDTQKFGDIILVDYILEYRYNRPYHGHEVQKSKEYR